MTDRERENAFRLARNDAMATRTAIVTSARDEIIYYLRLAERRIEIILADQPTDYQSWSLTNLQREIQRALAEAGDSSAAQLSTAAGKAWDAGIDLVDKPLAAGGVRIAAQLPVVSTIQLNAMRAFMTDRIRGITIAAANRINAMLGLVVIGAQSPFEATKAVQDVLGEETRARATTIVRTELSRVYATASFERLKLAAKHVPGMEKEWRKSGKLHPRPGHDLANGQRVAFDAPFKIVSKNGELIDMQFPHDPRAPAGEVINCGCVMLPRPPAFKGLKVS